MADPARIKTEDSPEKESFTNEEHLKTEHEPVPETSAETSANDSKEPSAQDHLKDLKTCVIWQIDQHKMEKKRMRKPNWTEEQCLLLAQLVEENRGVLKAKFGPGITVQTKRKTWERIAEQINASFPLLTRSSQECEKRWYVLQSKAREEIAALKRTITQTGGGSPAKKLSQVADTVCNVLAKSDTSITGMREGICSSLIQLVELPQSTEDPGPSTSQTLHAQPAIAPASALAPSPSLLEKKMEAEIDVLRQHKTVLLLKEEYYKLKIEYLKNKMQ
ncbi:transcription initiation factor TFIID subunit 11 isoform 1-T1 [Anableps anableps]